MGANDGDSRRRKSGCIARIDLVAWSGDSRSGDPELRRVKSSGSFVVLFFFQVLFKPSSGVCRPLNHLMNGTAESFFGFAFSASWFARFQRSQEKIGDLRVAVLARVTTRGKTTATTKADPSNHRRARGLTQNDTVWGVARGSWPVQRRRICASAEKTCGKGAAKKEGRKDGSERLEVRR